MTPRALTDWETAKLADIATLSDRQLRGWYAVITAGFHGHHRHPFPGEIAACHDRARALGINLSEAVE